MPESTRIAIDGYIQVDILFKLLIHEDASEDLRKVRRDEPEAAARIVALLQQVSADQDLLEHLTDHDFGARGSADFHVSKWQQQWRQGQDLWRLKVWDLEETGIRHRIVYAYLPDTRQYHVLAVAPREFDYDAEQPIGQRILRAYQDIQREHR